MGSKINQVIALLEGVSDGLVNADQALREWPSIDSEKDDLIKSAWHDLSHFATDKDIRTKEKEYDSRQRELLRNTAKEIRKKYID